MQSADFTADWHSHNVPHWRQILGEYADRPGLRALEIGSFEGRSALWLLNNVLTHETARIDCIDTFEGSPEHAAMGINSADLVERFLRNLKPYKEKVRWFRGRSQEVLRNGSFDPQGAEHYDIAYIDGSHKASDVLEDAVLSFRLLKVGGVMIFDDYFFNRPASEFDR